GRRCDARRSTVRGPLRAGRGAGRRGHPAGYRAARGRGGGAHRARGALCGRRAGGTGGLRERRRRTRPPQRPTATDPGRRCGRRRSDAGSSTGIELSRPHHEAPMSFLADFKTFAFKGNVVDLAVGVVIGGAFGKIVTALVSDIVMPAVSLILP